MDKVNAVELIQKLKNNPSNAVVARLSTEIEELKQQFDDTDYKTAKNVQYQALGKELPYSWEDIFTQAEAVRSQINQKETELNNILQLQQN